MMVHDEKNRLTRREVIRGTGAITIASLVSSAGGMEGATSPAQSGSASRDNAPLGQRIRGFQHFGMTVQNMDRAFAFYTEILGGTEIMPDGDFHGEKIHNTLNDEIEAIEPKMNPQQSEFRTCVAGSNDWTSASYNSTTWCSSC